MAEVRIALPSIAGRVVRQPITELVNGTLQEFCRNFALFLTGSRPNRPSAAKNLCIRKVLTNKAVNDD
jgi:hypothetical protein